MTPPSTRTHTHVANSILAGLFESWCVVWRVVLIPGGLGFLLTNADFIPFNCACGENPRHEAATPVFDREPYILKGGRDKNNDCCWVQLRPAAHDSVPWRGARQPRSCRKKIYHPPELAAERVQHPCMSSCNI